jgi:hypothetical protein
MRGASNEGRGPWRCQLATPRHSSPYEEQNPGPWLCASEACAAGAAPRTACQRTVPTYLELGPKADRVTSLAMKTVTPPLTSMA